MFDCVKHTELIKFQIILFVKENLKTFSGNKNNHPYGQQGTRLSLRALHLAPICECVLPNPLIY